MRYWARPAGRGLLTDVRSLSPLGSRSLTIDRSVEWDLDARSGVSSSMGWTILALVVALTFYLAIHPDRVPRCSAGSTGQSVPRLSATRGEPLFTAGTRIEGMTDPPTVSFNYNGSTVRVGLAPQFPGQPTYPRTRVVARFAKGPAVPARTLPGWSTGPRAASQEGQGRFAWETPSSTETFLVQANDPEMARDFLTAPVRWALIGLAQDSRPPGGMLLSINPERMLVQVDKKSRNHSIGSARQRGPRGAGDPRRPAIGRSLAVIRVESWRLSPPVQPRPRTPVRQRARSAATRSLPRARAPPPPGSTARPAEHLTTETVGTSSAPVRSSAARGRRCDPRLIRPEL